MARTGPPGYNFRIFIEKLEKDALDKQAVRFGINTGMDLSLHIVLDTSIQWRHRH